MSELVQHTGAPLPDKIEYARHLAGSNLLPKHYRQQPANLLFALEYADALGVSPIHAITSIHVIEGKPSASADLIASLVRRAGHRLRVTGDDTYAEAIILRADDPEFEFKVRWDMDRARTAGLTGKGVWKSYPAAMLRSRAITEVARMGAPDALFGVIYSPEELGAEVDAEGEVVAQAPRQQAARSVSRSGGARLRDAAAAQTPAPAPAEDVVDAEVEPDPNDPATDDQRRQIIAAAAELDVTSKEDVLAMLSGVLGRDVESTEDVLAGEVDDVLAKVHGMAGTAA